MDSFWQAFWVIVQAFVFIAYLIIVFNVIGDLFRDRQLGVLAKALWLIALIIFPFLTAFIYVIARGKGFDERARQARSAAETQVEDYIRTTANSSPSQEIATAKALLDAGTISDAEFQALKSAALANLTAGRATV